MKRKFLAGLAAGLSLLGLAANQAHTEPFITETGVEGTNSTITVDGKNWIVENNAWNCDVWNDDSGGFTWSEQGTAGHFQYSGTYLGTFSGNAEADDLADLAGYYLERPIGSSWYKVESPHSADGPLNLTYAGDGKSGTWNTELADPAMYVSFYTVKAGSQFSLYFVDPAADYGYWSTVHLPVGQPGNIPEISHLAILADPGTPVPEPATMLLFGTGLLGLAGLARRKAK